MFVRLWNTDLPEEAPVVPVTVGLSTFATSMPRREQSGSARDRFSFNPNSVLLWCKRVLPVADDRVG